jgi:ELWxxDGT repeat protein
MLAVSFELLKDVNTENTTSFSPLYPVEMGGYAYFAGTTAPTKTELWRSDGTLPGTTLVKSFNVVENLVNANGTLFFTASDIVHGMELWTSDGTPEGTSMVLDIQVGGSWTPMSSLVHANGKVFFLANDGVNGTELWISDGTAGGTHMVKNIGLGSNGAGIQHLAAFGDGVVFAGPGNGSDVVWLSDGTENGTMKLTADGQEIIEPSSFMPVGDVLYYSSLFGLVKTDGTVAGTTLVKSFSTSNPPKSLVNYNGTLYFLGYDSTNGYELWKSDGTEAGTVLVKNCTSGVSSSTLNFTSVVDGILYFKNNFQLWRSDGTAAGTFVISNTTSGEPFSPVFRVGGKLLFSGRQELWETDGTLAGSHQFVDIYPGSSDSDTYSLVQVDELLLFGANDGKTGRELWRTDGTVAGTQQVADLYAITDSSSPHDLAVKDGELYFLADAGANSEFWKSDGTRAGTTIVRDLATGFSYTAESLTVFGDQVLVSVHYGNSGEQLWTSDGSEGGTTLLKLLRATVQSQINLPRPSYFKEAGGLVYFGGLGGPTPLWRTDGTEPGTDSINAPFTSYLAPTAEYGNVLLFFAQDAAHGYELWRTDGTDSGTHMIKDIFPGPTGSADVQYTELQSLTVMGGVAYFFARNTASNYELWRTDGTLEGTYQLVEINPGTAGSRNALGLNKPYMLAIGNTLYFAASNGSDGIGYGTELWKSDGTAAGTMMVANLNSSGGSNPGLLTNIGGVLYFTGDDGASGRQIWKLAPGDSVPTQVTSVAGGVSTSSTAALVDIHGTIYFSASGPGGGLELWRTDGTMAGTEFVYDFTLDATGSDPSLFTALNGRFIVSVQTAGYGRELWVGDFSAQGDFNLDGDVDSEDFDLWRGSFGSTSALAADANRDGVVDAGDYVVWRKNRELMAAATGGKGTVSATAVMGTVSATAARAAAVTEVPHEKRTRVTDQAIVQLAAENLQGRATTATHRKNVARPIAEVGRPRSYKRLGEMEMQPLDEGKRLELLKDDLGLRTTDNAIIPLKPGVVDQLYDPVKKLFRVIFPRRQ